VIGFANILKKNSSEKLSEKELSYVARIVSNGKLLLEIIGDVLDLSKIEAGRMEPTSEQVELPELVRESVRTLEVHAARKGLALEVEVPPDVAPRQTDSRRLQQIILNLLSNAVKFTDEGRVNVRVITENGSNRPQRIEVEDSGPGIPEDRLADIFEAFRQAEGSTARRYGGTGLGLTICRSLAELLDFSMDVQSEVGEGSTFAVVLDASSAVSPDASSDASPGPDDAEGSSAAEQGDGHRSS
jgi:signal transduction histidine kinase